MTVFEGEARRLLVSCAEIFNNMSEMERRDLIAEIFRIHISVCEVFDERIGVDQSSNHKFDTMKRIMERLNEDDWGRICSHILTERGASFGVWKIQFKGEGSVAPHLEMVSTINKYEKYPKPGEKAEAIPVIHKYAVTCEGLIAEKDEI